MDPLEHLALLGADLLNRVDDALADGAPAEHRIWPLLRRLRVLPGEAAGALTALRPAPLADAGTALRNLLQEYDDAGATLSGTVTWQGAGADAFAARRSALGAHLLGDPEGLAGRLRATAGYAESLADWVEDSRAALARTLAQVLGSAEAVTLVTGGPAGALAAAEIGARVLATVAEAYDRAEALRQRWAPSLGEVAYRAQIDGPSRIDATTRVE